MDIQQWSRSHAPRGNAPIDAPRRVRNLSLEIITTNRDAERQDSRSHAERGNEFVFGNEFVSCCRRSLIVAAMWLSPVANLAFGADLILQGPAKITAEFSGTDEPFLLPPTRWIVFSRSAPRGTLIQWTAAPFVHSRDDRFAVDSRLQIAAVRRGLGRQSNSPIGVIVPQDETIFRAGDRSATVTAILLQPGFGGVDLQVAFVPRDASTVAAGEYVLRVVGTVTGN